MKTKIISLLLLLFIISASNAQEPCSALNLLSTVSNDEETCCYNISLENKYGNIDQIDFESLTPGVIINHAETPSIYPWACPPTDQKVCMDFPNGFNNTLIENAIQICLGDVTSSPQQILVSWYETMGEEKNLVCTDTLYFECQPPHVADKCWDIEGQVTCDSTNDSKIYNYQFTVTNQSAFDATNITLYDITNGLLFLQGSNTYPVITIPTFISGGGTAIVNIQISSLIPITIPISTCFKISLTGKTNEGLNVCCNSQEELCLDLLPCCEPCENVKFTMEENPNDTCGYCLKLDNPCQDANFAFFDLDVIGNFGINTASLGSGFYLLNNTSTNLRIGHFGGIPQGSDIDALCLKLSNITSSSPAPQQVKVTWWETTSGGETIQSCIDTLEFDCIPPYGEKCYEIIEESIICGDIINGEQTYNYQFTLLNTAGFDISDIKLYALTPGFTFLSTGLDYIDISQIIINAGSGTINVKLVYSGSPLLPTNACFKTSVKGRKDGLWQCCNYQGEHCILVEECEGIGEPHCLLLDSLDIICNMDGSFTMDFTAINKSSVLANFIKFTALTPTSYTFQPSSLPINSPISNGQSFSSSIDILGALPGSTITFEVLLEDLTQPSDCCCARSDTFTIVLPNCYDCVELDDYEIICLPNGNYDFAFTITNTSNPSLDANFIKFTPISPSGVNYAPNGITLSSILYNGSSHTDTTEIIGGNPGDTLLFEITLEDLTQSTDCCCLQSDTIEIILPDCTGCIELDEYEIICLPNGNYDFGFKITNTSNPAIDANNIKLIPINTSSVNYTPSTISLTNILYTGSSHIDTVEISGGNPGDTLLFEIIIEDTIQLFECQSDTIEIILPDCQNTNPCLDMATMTVPGFSPNGDAINDFYDLPEYQKCGDINIAVYNIWGQEVYRMKNYDGSWNGDGPKGSPLPDGTYYAIIEVVSTGKIKTGFVSLLR